MASNPAEERKQPSVEREYRTDRITVRWEPSLCIHTANCLLGLPDVFDVNARPWIKVENASADEIAEVVMTCPTGALSFERTDGAPQEPRPEQTTITPRKDGPLFVRGDIRVAD